MKLGWDEAKIGSHNGMVDANMALGSWVGYSGGAVPWLDPGQYKWRKGAAQSPATTALHFLTVHARWSALSSSCCCGFPP